MADIEEYFKKSDLKIKPEELPTGILIFTILPGAKQYETQELMQKYARIKDLFRAGISLA